MGVTELTKLEQDILRLTGARGPEKSICPSEVARAAAPGEDAWRRQMVAVRRAAIGLARQGRIDILRKGRPVPLPAPGEADADVKGVIRLRIRQEPPDGGTLPD